MSERRRSIKNCFGEYSSSSPKCLLCDDRLSCMSKKYNEDHDNLKKDQIEKNLRIPICFGSYLGAEDCDDCSYSDDCRSSSSNLEQEFFRRGKHVRLGGKYKGRGKYKPKDLY